MDFFIPGTFALIYVLIGMLLGDAVRVIQGRMRRTVAVRNTPEPPPADPPVPLDDPRRDPNWCHSHNQMQPCDGCRR